MMTGSLRDLRRRAEEEYTALENGDQPRILVGTATCGRSAGALEVVELFRQLSEEHGLDCHLIEVGCIGLCYAEPIVCIIKPSRAGIFYGEVDCQRAKQLFDAYLLGDDPLPQFALGAVGSGADGSGADDRGAVDGIHPLWETPVFKLQVRRTLRNCGFIDPTKIEHYLANDGYRGLEKALQLGPDRIVNAIKASGLRGKGGAAFPVWRKWQFARDANATTKYLIANGSEGDPGTFSNKLLFESDPHSVLEGMLIAAYANHAEEGYLYCPADYPLALERLRMAVRQMEQRGLLGDDILGSRFNFHLHVKVGAGAYICGEESALIECIEGKRGIPRVRPPFPPVSGLWSRPTIVHNIETLACVTLVLQNGAAWFAQPGTATSKGTKLFCLSGNIQRSGVVEAPFGITLNELIHSIGGGVPGGQPLKAVQTGGPAGGCLPPDLLHLPVDHDSLLDYGSSLGSGGVVALDQHACMVDLARNAIHFTQQECCGQCLPCRLGTRQLLMILEDITQGKAEAEDIDLLLDLSRGIKAGSLCGLGQAAPNPLLGTLRYFRQEYEMHITEKRCPAAVCRKTDLSPC